MRHSPPRRPGTARWTATSDDEQAVSTVSARALQAEHVGRGVRRRRSPRCPCDRYRSKSSPSPVHEAAARSRCCRCRRTRRCAVPVQRVRGDAGVLQRLPRDLQQQPLLRVHATPPRAARCRRSCGSKRSIAVEEAGPAGGDLAGCVRIRVVVRVDVPPRSAGPRGSRRRRRRSSSQYSSMPSTRRAAGSPSRRWRSAPTRARPGPAPRRRRCS